MTDQTLRRFCSNCSAKFIDGACKCKRPNSGWRLRDTVQLIIDGKANIDEIPAGRYNCWSESETAIIDQVSTESEEWSGTAEMRTQRFCKRLLELLPQ